MKTLLHYFLVLISIMIVCEVCAQKRPPKLFIDTSSEFFYNWKSINISFTEEEIPGETILPDSLIRIDTISKKEFLKYKKAYSSKILMDTSVIYRTDTSFILKKENFSDTFQAFRICECTAASYLGLIEPLNLYMVNLVDMHNEIAFTILLDSRTGKSFDVPTCSDPGPEGVLISPKEGYLLTFSNSFYNRDNCCIYLIKIDKNVAEHSYKLSSYLEVNLNRLNIKEMAWVNDRSFVLSVNDQVNPEDYNERHKLSYWLKISLNE